MTARFLPSRRGAMKAIAGLTLAALAATATAQQLTRIRFQLDWRFEGPAALFVLPVAKGYFKQEGLDVIVDAGNGSGGTVTRVASGAYDMGFADIAAMIEFLAANQGNPSARMQAVYMLYDYSPAAVLALKKSGIRTPADLAGKKLGAPVFDAGRKAWPIFAKANGIGTVAWTAMDPPLRETMLVRGDVDAITGFSFTSLLNIEARGIKAEDVVVLPYQSHGVKMYGNAIIVSEQFLQKNPEAVKAFLRAFTKGTKDVIADPKAAIATLKARDGLVNEELELRRLKLALDATVLTADARAEGFGEVRGPRLSLMASQVSDAFATKERINPAAVWKDGFLPSAAERDIFKVARK